MKVIDILNKIANKELKNNTKFRIIGEDGKAFICRYDNKYPGEIWVLNEKGRKISFNYSIDHMRILNYEVELLEDEIDIDNIKEITEIATNSWNEAEFNTLRNIAVTLNQVVQAVKQLNRNQKNKMDKKC